MRESFRENLRLNPANKQRLRIINEIIEEYRQEGYVLTLRQLYYQLVSRDIIPNKQSEYAKLSTLLTKGRMAGVVDWEAIEDRNRRPYLPYWVSGIEGAIRDTINQYRLDRQKGQDYYIELWVEKDALSGVLKRITEHYHIRLIVNKGYSSTSAMYDAYERVKRKLLQKKKVVILYLGDHDPSGLDMIRDIRDRTREFISNSEDVKEIWEDEREHEFSDEIWDRDEFSDNILDKYEYDDDSHVKEDGEEWFDYAKGFGKYLFDERVEVRPIGLTMKQIKQFAPPPNPAKITDPRAKWYIEKFGRVSWEVDALNPETLHKLVRENVESLIDMDLFQERVEQEESDKEKLRRFSIQDDE